MVFTCPFQNGQISKISYLCKMEHRHILARRVRDWLDETFPLRWMGRGTANEPAPFAWPPFSPDLTPMDFFLWGWIKSRVYTTPIGNIAELRGRIERAFQELPQQMINRALDSYKRRLERCLAVNGRGVEQEYGD
jgi:hypothetical protein